MVPRGIGGRRGVGSPPVFGSGGLGLRARTWFERWRGRVTLGAAQTRQGTLGSLDSPFAAAPSGETQFNPKTQAQPRDHRGTAPSVRTYLFSETHRSSRAATTAAKTASVLSGSNWVQAQPAGRCPDSPRNLRFLGFSICCRAFGRNGVRTPKKTQAQPRGKLICSLQERQ